MVANRIFKKTAKRLPAFLSPCCPRCVALISALLFSGYTSELHAGETNPLDIQTELPTRLVSPKTIPPDEYRMIDEIVKGTQSQPLFSMNPQVSYSSEPLHNTFNTSYGGQTLLFASISLGERALEAILSEASAQGATVLFRGIPKDTAWLSSITYLQQLASQFTPIPEVMIDPTAFVHYKVTSVPTLILQHHNQVTGRVQGVYSIAWLREQVDKTATVDHGVRGPIAEISEPDLISVMQQKTLALDGETLIEHAKARFWQQIPFLDLPTATDCLQTSLDPTVMLTRPIKDANGKIILPALTRINPLKQLPFTQTLVIFDATDDSMRNAVQNWLSRQASILTHHTLITTKLHRDSGWQGLAEYESELGQPLYLLPNSVRTRFAVGAIPTVITANEEHFLIAEGCLQ